jgi:hypothetical protein
MTAEHPLPIRIPGGTVFGGDWTDPGPLPAEITTPEFLAGVAPDGLHAIGVGALLALAGCTAHAWAVCGTLVQPVAGGQRYEPAAVPWPACPECRWMAAARTNTQAAALAAMGDPLAQAVAAAILVRARDEGRDLDDARALQLLAHVSRHEPARLVDEGCAEGDHDGHEPGQCPGRDACRACSLQAGSWAGEREGQFLGECTILSPCGPLLALAAHFAVAVPGA